MKDGYTHIADNQMRIYSGILSDAAIVLNARLESNVKDGEVIMSKSDLCKLWGWNKMKLLRATNELEKVGLWTCETRAGRTGFSKWIKGNETIPFKKVTKRDLLKVTKCDLLNNINIINTLRDNTNNVLPSSTAPLPASVCEEPATKEPKKVFRKPTVEEVRAYCEERRNGIDPEHWFDYYESNGWMVGRSHMKDWRAAVRTWEAKDKERNNKKSNHYGRPHTSPAEAARAAALGIALADAERADV